jgi:SAM-dependent methyltransferase
MRVIRIVETKKRVPSAPVLETVEASYAEIERDLEAVHGEARSPAAVPEDVEPISEVEPVLDLEGPDAPDPVVVEVEPVAPPARPPAPSAGPTLPGGDSLPDWPPADRKRPPPRRSARPSLPKATHPRKKAWWETIFGDDFSRAYRPMSQSQLAYEVYFILEGLNLQRGAVILDLACGQGEICVELARRGYSVVGYDLSVYQLAMAGDNAQQAKQKINFLQGDMREMAFEEMFDAIICWDTSFGYFEDEKNVEVLQRIKKALKPGGRLILDVMNRVFAAREAPYNHWFEGDGCVCMDDMSLDWITNRLRVKRSIILDDGRSKELQYTTRLYTLSELGRVLHEVGFRVSAVSGDVHTKGAFFGPHSRRIIIQAGKP